MIICFYCLEAASADHTGPTDGEAMTNRPMRAETGRILCTQGSGGQWCALHLEREEAAIDREVRACDERRLIRAEEEGERGNLLRFAHASNRLSPGQLLEHLGLTTWVIRFQVSVNERCVHTRRRDAVAADVLIDVIARHGV